MKQVIHAEVFRIVDDKVEFLLIKRVPEDGGFWQPVTGGIEEGEEIIASLIREVSEETGIKELLHISPQIHYTEWDYNGDIGRDLVHAVEAAHNVQVKLNPLEHDDHVWLQFEEAIEKLYFEGNKESMKHVHTYIHESYLPCAKPLSF